MKAKKRKAEKSKKKNIKQFTRLELVRNETSEFTYKIIQHCMELNE